MGYAALPSRRTASGGPAVAIGLLCLALAAPAGAAPPSASIITIPSSPAPGQAVTFTARAVDPDGTIASYAWELDDDGGFDDGSAPEATVTYAAAGTYRVSLRVTDNAGEAFAVYTDVQVAEPDPLPPEPPPAPAPAPPPPPAPPALLDPFPVVRVAGRITSAGVHVTLVTVRAPVGARIVAFCRGGGCRRRQVIREAAARQRLRRLEGRYRAGARLVFRITGSDRVGKYTRVVVRRGVAPARTDRCLFPGQTRPQACPD
jgi:PKD domain